jgi:uncharacterized protein with von Willebrand factor type A (vWA) domain
VLVRFFQDLRAGGVPVTLPEFLSLLQALEARVAWLSAEDFYHLARVCLVKDERHYDRFDRVFAEHFRGAEKLFEAFGGAVPEDWLRALAERTLSEEEKARVEALGGWEKLMETLRQRLAGQQGRHEGGNKWIGTGGTSPFGAFGYNPEGVRIGQPGSRHRRAVKVWDRRDFANFDDTLELGTRNFKMGLRRLRRFAREGSADELDLDGTISATARNAGHLDLKLVPERRNAVKVLLLLDVGGSMDDHVRVCDELFSAARSEFRHFEHYYFHNFPYESLWKDNRRRHTERIATEQLIRTYGPDYRVIFVGDATMSPYEITMPGGSVEHWNAEAGALWLRRLTAHFRHFAWLNPEPVKRWDYTPSITITRELVEGRMFPLTLEGLDLATAELRRRGTAPPPLLSPSVPPP